MSNFFKRLEKKVRDYAPDPKFKDDALGLITVKEALRAAKDGNYGVGACLADKNGKVILKGHNHMVDPYSRTDMHAEMNVITRYEDMVRAKKPGMRDFTLFSSLEPCPMCFVRLIYTGMRKAFYLADDPTGGMVRHLRKLPVIFRKFARGRQYAIARCSPELRKLAYEVFACSARVLDKKFKEL